MKENKNLSKPVCIKSEIFITIIHNFQFLIPVFVCSGGWGKPPVDEAGKPLYGDVFGTSDSRNFPATPAEDVSGWMD